MIFAVVIMFYHQGGDVVNTVVIHRVFITLVQYVAVVAFISSYVTMLSADKLCFMYYLQPFTGARNDNINLIMQFDYSFIPD